MGVWGLIMKTTYTVRSKNTDDVLEFIYDLNGVLTSFKILRGSLDGRKAKWLFSPRFPAFESMMKTIWMKEPEYTKNLRIEAGELDLSFETFMKAYRHRIKKQQAKKAWEKLSKADKIEALKGIKSYDAYLVRKQVPKCNPQAYLNQRRWEDDFNSIH